jgi:hypothetical protein
VLGGVGYWSHKERINRIDPNEPGIRKWDRRLAERANRVDEMRYMLGLIPIGVVLLTIGVLWEAIGALTEVLD